MKGKYHPCFYVLILFLMIAFIAGCGGGDNTSTNENRLSENALIVEKDTQMTLTQVVDDTYTYSYSGSPPDIKPGNILLSGEGNGYLRKVVSVEDQDGTLVIITEQASLEDAFQELHLHETITMDSNILQKGLILEQRSAKNKGSVGIKQGNITIKGSNSADLDIFFKKYRI